MRAHLAIANQQARPPAPRRAGRLGGCQESAFDRIVRLTGTALDMPIALIALIDEESPWTTKAAIGIEAGMAPHDLSFCGHALEHPDTVVVVDNPLQDSRFRNNPCVTGRFGLRFYAGAPLVTGDGQAIGALCVMDTRPRPAPDAEMVAVLRDLADTVVDELELQRAVGDAATAVQVAEEITASKNAFMASLSHEFRTPMTSIMGFGELLAMDWAAAADRTDAYAQEIVRSSEQVLALINDLIELSRIEAGQAALDIQAVPVADEIGLVTSLLAERAATLGIRLDNRVGTDVVVQADSLSLRQLLVNLIGCAIWRAGCDRSIRLTDRTLPDGRIAVDLASAAGDDGPVLPIDRHDRVTATAARSGEIGLMIARRMAVAMHGDVNDNRHGTPGGVLSLLLPAAG